MSLKLVPFESLGAVSYSLSIVTVAASLAVCEIFSFKNRVILNTRLRVVQGHWYGSISICLYSTKRLPARSTT